MQLLRWASADFAKWQIQCPNDTKAGTCISYPMKSAARWLSTGLFAMLWMSACAWAQAAPNKDGLPTFVIPNVAKKLTIIAYGDARFTDPVDTTHSDAVVRRALIDKIAAEKPDALLFSGDMPYRGSNDNDWQQVDKEIKPLWDAKMRIYPALGNHELFVREQRGLQNWWKRFP